MTQAITSFSGQYRFLSNFYPSPIVWDGYDCATVEHGFQLSKTFDEYTRGRIAKAATPGAAKRLGRMVNLRPDWEDVKLSIMLRLLRKKFVGSLIFGQQLLDTEDAGLIEGNTWGDQYWGVCKGIGENHLGKLLMQVREELRSERQG